MVFGSVSVFAGFSSVCSFGVGGVSAVVFVGASLNPLIATFLVGVNCKEQKELRAPPVLVWLRFPKQKPPLLHKQMLM
jgi:hypothetical protein